MAGIHDVLGSLSAIPAKADGKRSDIGGSQRHIWLAHIDDQAKLEATAKGADEKLATRAKAILARGNQAPKVEAAFGPLSGLESILPQLAEKSGAVKAGNRVLMSLTEKEYGEMVAALKASGK